LADNGLVFVEDIQDRLPAGASSNEAALGAGRQFFASLLEHWV
jgi:hypothetical protein